MVAVVEGDFTVKRLSRLDGRPALVPENDSMAPIFIGDDEQVRFGGSSLESTQAETRSPEIVGLVDGHCYYVSCHRLFEPRLDMAGLLSCCPITTRLWSVRSDEAKALGVKMSQPRSELEPLVRHHGLILRSSNYTLYQDIHQRFMRAIGSMVARPGPLQRGRSLHFADRHELRPL